MKKGFWVGLFIIFCVSLVPLYFYRASYVEIYDLSYVQDHYHHSQWSIPNSPWGIGDDGLYQYVGNELAHGADPYSINAEAPPLGKYLYGFSIRFLGNPYFAILPLYFLTIGAFYLLTAYFIQNNNWRLFATFLLVSSPLFFLQLTATALDLPQVCWLLIHIVIMFKLVSIKNKPWQIALFTILAGFTFGLFMGSKFGVVGILIILADGVLLYQCKRLRLILGIGLVAGLTYTAGYIAHFMQGGNLVTWLKGQKWIMNYWLHNQPKVSPFFIFITLLTGWWTNGQKAVEWTILWPASTLAFIGYGYFLLKRKLVDSHMVYIALLTAGFILIFAFNFFWVRYLLVLIPFLIIFLVKFLAGRNFAISLFLTLLVLISTGMSLSPSLHATQLEIKYAWENNLYKDIYNYLSVNDQRKYTRVYFDQTAKIFDHGLDFPPKKITFTPNGKVTIEYQTNIGIIKNIQPVQFVKENNRWKIRWNWDLITEGFTPSSKVVVVPESYQAGMVSDLSRPLAKWSSVPHVAIIPGKIPEKNRENILKSLEDATNIGKEKIRILAYVHDYPDWALPIGPIIGKELATSSGIVIQNELTRTYTYPKCYAAIKKAGAEKGGQIFLSDPSGQKISLLKKLVGC